MALFYDTAGIPIQIATPNINYGALANVRPLSFGQDPIQIAPLAPWQVPEAKPYIAQGITQAASGIGQGLAAAGRAKTELERQKAIDARELAKETARNAREDAIETARANLEREKLRSAETIARMRAVKSSVDDRSNEVFDGNPDQLASQQADLKGSILPDSEDEVNAQDQRFTRDTKQPPSGPVDIVIEKRETLVPSAEQKQLSDLRSSGLQARPLNIGLADVQPVSEFQTRPLAIGSANVLPNISSHLLATLDRPTAAVKTLISVPSASAPAPAPAPAPAQSPANTAVAAAVPPTIPLLDEDSNKPAAGAAPATATKTALPTGEVVISTFKPDANFGFQNNTIPLSKTVLSGDVDLTNKPALGTNDANQDSSLVKAVKDTPELGNLEGLRSPSSKKTSATEVQEVNPKDIVPAFRNNSDAARYALAFNKKYSNSRILAKVVRPTKEVPNWTINYEDVGEQRAAHRSSEQAKVEVLEFKRDAKVGNMAKNYEAQPTAKLMSTREDAMRRMLVAYENRKRADNSVSKATIDQELKELFVMFASGKAPTEAQFSEISHAFPGLPNYLQKKMEFWKSGATLNNQQVETIKNLMIETYNNSANQVNSQLSDIESILKTEHPNINPKKLPVKYPILETEEELKDEALKLKEKLSRDPSFKQEYDNKIGELIKKREFFKIHGLPSNLGDITRPPRKPGFHSYLFSASPDLSNFQPPSQ
jgi:hypothetical protein